MQISHADFALPPRLRLAGSLGEGRLGSFHHRLLEGAADPHRVDVVADSTNVNFALGERRKELRRRQRARDSTSGAQLSSSLTGALRKRCPPSPRARWRASR